MGPGGTVIAAIEAVARTRPDARAVVDDGRAWTYRQLWDRVEAYARGVLALGHSPGQPIGILGQNSADYLVAYLAIMRAGCVAVPVNTLLDVVSIRDQLDLVGARTVIVGTVPDELHAGLEGAYLLLGMADLPTGPARPALPSVTVDSVSSIMLTSGSTGRPKGVEHTHATLRHAVAAMAEAFPFDAGDRSVVFLPLYTCIPEAVLPVLCRGGSLEILPGFDVERVADACTRATTFDAVPTILSRLLENAPLSKLAGLRWILFASEPMPVRLLQRWWEALPGVATHQFYGMTEHLTITAAPDELLRVEPSTVGRAFPGTRVSVRVLDGYRDGSGEILAASPCLMRGYHRDEATTRDALTSAGDLRTGDIGRVDERGLLFLTGRLKDIIISGGFNIAPAEIEAVAFSHRGVQEAIVVGVPSERWGETPVVVAVAKQNSEVTPENLLHHCRAALPGFKRPTAAALVSSLPTTGIGKGDKALVRRLIADGTIPLVTVAERTRPGPGAVGEDTHA